MWTMAPDWLIDRLERWAGLLVAYHEHRHDPFTQLTASSKKKNRGTQWTARYIASFWLYFSLLSRFQRGLRTGGGSYSRRYLQKHVNARLVKLVRRSFLVMLGPLLQSASRWYTKRFLGATTRPGFCV